MSDNLEVQDVELDEVKATGENSMSADPVTPAGGAVKASMLVHKDTLVLVEQVGVRSQTQYKQEFLANMYTADTLYGTGVLRNDSGFVLAVNA